MGDLLFVGSYTGDSGGEGEGIVRLRRDPGTGDLTEPLLAARTPSPSFLARHPTLPVLYAVNELELGTVTAFVVAAGGALDTLEVRPTGGEHPCHLAVTRDGRHLVVANYSSGSVSVHPIGPDGRPGERTDQLDLDGHGPDPERQKSAHAHMVLPDATGHVLIADLGSDRVWRARLDERSGRLTGLTAAIVTPPGTGPRHVCVTPDGALLLVGELSAELSPHRDGRATGVQPSTGASGAAHPSEIVVRPDGRFVYVANRGPDTVAAFSWDGNDALRVAEVPTGGAWPRHIALVGDLLYVANERSHSVTHLRVDPGDGRPVLRGTTVDVRSPTCCLWWNSA